VAHGGERRRAGEVRERRRGRWRGGVEVDVPGRELRTCEVIKGGQELVARERHDRPAVIGNMKKL
jgi:hypothetical protein